MPGNCQSKWRLRKTPLAQLHLGIVVPAVVDKGDHALRSPCLIYAGSIYHGTVQRHADHMLRLFIDALKWMLGRKKLRGLTAAEFLETTEGRRLARSAVKTGFPEHVVQQARNRSTARIG